MLSHVRRLATVAPSVQPVELVRVRPLPLRLTAHSRALRLSSRPLVGSSNEALRRAGQSDSVAEQERAADRSLLAVDEDEDVDESAYDIPPAGPPPLVSGALGAARLDVNRDWWEDNQIFGPPSIINPILFDRTGKHQLLLALGQCHSLDHAITIARRLLRAATASLLTPHNYTFILMTLQGHARPMLQQSTYHSPGPSQSGAPSGAVLCSIVCDVVEASFVYGWQLSSRSYACALYMIASLDDERCLQLLSSVEACQEVILSDGWYGAVIAYLQRHRNNTAVCQLWRSMQLRYERDRRHWDVPLQQFLSSHLLDDEKQAEIAALAVGAACQQLWMYHRAIAAALRIGQANTALGIVQQLHQWQQRYTCIRSPSEASVLSVSALPSSSQPLFEHVNFRAAAVEPVWSALTYYSVLSAHAAAGEWWLLTAVLRDMTAAGMLLPLHRSTVTRVAECAIRQRRWFDLRSLLSFIEQDDPQLLSLELVGLLTKRLEAAARTLTGDDARLAAIESERLVRFCLTCLEQQHILRAFDTRASGSEPPDSSSELLSFVVHFASAMPLPVIRRLVALLLLSSDQRRRTGHTPTRLFFRCESEQVLAITSHVRALGGSALVVRSDAECSSARSLLAEYDSLQRSSGGSPTRAPSPYPTASDRSATVLFVSAAAARPQAVIHEDGAASPELVPSVSMFDSSCSAGRLLRDVLQLRDEASWLLLKRYLKRNKRRLAAAGVEADTPFIEATVRCWAFRPTQIEVHERPATIARLLQSLDGQPQSSPTTPGSSADSSASFPLTRSVCISDLSAAAQLCCDRRILHSLPPSAIQPAASLISLHERMSVMTVHCAMMLPLLQLQCRYPQQQPPHCADAAALPAIFVQSLDERLLHIAAHFLRSVCGLHADWLTPLSAADDSHSTAVSLLTSLRSTTSQPASAASRVLHISRDAVCGWLMAGGQLNDTVWLERCLQTDEGNSGDEQSTRVTGHIESAAVPSAVGGAVAVVESVDNIYVKMSTQ